MFSLVSHLFPTLVSIQQLSKGHHARHEHTRLEKITQVSAPCASLLMTQGNEPKLISQLDHASDAHFHRRPILHSS